MLVRASRTSAKHHARWYGECPAPRNIRQVARSRPSKKRAICFGLRRQHAAESNSFQESVAPCGCRQAAPSRGSERGGHCRRRQSATPGRRPRRSAVRCHRYESFSPIVHFDRWRAGSTSLWATYGRRDRYHQRRLLQPHRPSELGLVRVGGSTPVTPRRSLAEVDRSQVLMHVHLPLAETPCRGYRIR
jgi:hypothetical protein